MFFSIPKFTTILAIWRISELNINQCTWDAFDYATTVAIGMQDRSNKKERQPSFGFLRIENSVQADALFLLVRNQAVIVASHFH